MQIDEAISAKEQNNVSPIVDELIRVFEDKSSDVREGLRRNVSKTVSTMAVVYEKIRNAVEFRAEHLVRRAAVERILKRRIILNGGASNIAENLVLELLWAKYIDSGVLDDSKVTEIERVIERYFVVKEHLFTTVSKHGAVSWDTILGLAAAEIEEILVSGKRREALVEFLYQATRPRVKVTDHDEKIVNMQTYVAVQRAYAQADDPIIAYRLLSMVQPNWTKTAPEKVKEHLVEFMNSLQLIYQNLHHPLEEQLTRFVRRQVPPYLLLRDFFLEVNGEARNIINEPDKFATKLEEIASRRYQEIGIKVRRAVVRSIIYIFLTKMIFALALEAPVDLFITKRIDYIPLIINAVFPPFLLFLLAGFFNVPGGDNTKRLVERIKKIIYSFGELAHESNVFTTKAYNKRPILTAVFSLFYLVMFLVSFGLISFVLTKLHFNLASQIIFVFFITLVSFFAYRIRVSAKEYEIIERQGFLEPMLDLFFLPILRAGYYLSSGIAKLNIFIFIFDFILEAPLKVIFEVIEEWIHFIRAKKEEIL